MKADPGLHTATIYRADSRHMEECAIASVDLVVTSPPYWQIKDYDSPGQIGHGQTLHAYLADLASVWSECARVLRPGARLCVNIGDQFASATLHCRYRVIPLHAEAIGQCVSLGLDYMGSIIWRKKTTMNTSGGATIMGSYPYPPNGIVELDFEYILLFKKPGKAAPVDRDARQKAAMTLEEWKSWFSGHWDVGGAHKKGHEAPFPLEIPTRLIRMFSLPEGLVLDPFLGTGTTLRAAFALGRNGIGYELNPRFAAMAEVSLRSDGVAVRLMERGKSNRAYSAPPQSWAPRVPDMASAVADTDSPSLPALRTVTAVGDDCTLTLADGTRVGFYGLHITDAAAAIDYLRRRVLRKKVFLRDERGSGPSAVSARVILKNRISVNVQLVKAGFAIQDEKGNA